MTQGSTMGNEYKGMEATTYEALYERFLKRSPRELLEAAGMERGKSVLDLCAGPTCRLTKEALNLGASEVTVVDKCFGGPNRVIFPNPEFPYLDKIQTFCWDVRTFLDRDFNPPMKFDIIACQQAVNYWWMDAPSPAKNLARYLAPNGAFVFNTFNTPPPREPKFSEYMSEEDENGRRDSIYEVVQLVERCDDLGVVHHIQARTGHEPHLTSFDWIPPDVFEGSLRVGFSDIKKITDKGTDIYVCMA